MYRQSLQKVDKVEVRWLAEGLFVGTTSTKGPQRAK